MPEPLGSSDDDRARVWLVVAFVTRVGSNDGTRRSRKHSAAYPACWLVNSDCTICNENERKNREDPAKTYSVPSPIRHEPWAGGRHATASRLGHQTSGSVALRSQSFFDITESVCVRFVCEDAVDTLWAIFVTVAQGRCTS